MLLWGERLKEALDDIVDAANGVERDEEGNLLPGGGAGGGWAGGASSQASTQASSAAGAGQARGCTVLVLVAPDADALCAARIVGHLLEQAHVDAKIVPVGGYTEVVAQAKAAGPALRSVIMLNCGSLPDVAALLWKDYPSGNGGDDEGEESIEDEGWVRLPETARVYIIDAHRPYRHRNLRSPHRVVVLDVEETPDGGAGVPRVGDSDVEAEAQSEEERRRDAGLPSDSEEEGGSDDDDDEEEGSDDGDDSSGSGSDDGSSSGSSDGSRGGSDAGSDADSAGGGDGDGVPGSGKKAKRRRAGDDKKGGKKGDDADADAAAAAKRRRRLRKAGGGEDGDDSDGGDAGYDRAEDTGVEGDDEGGGDKDDDADAAADDDSDADSAAAARRRKAVRRNKAAEARAAAAALRTQLRASRHAVVKRYRSYYAGDKYGLPAAFVAYHLAEKVRREGGAEMRVKAGQERCGFLGVIQPPPPLLHVAWAQHRNPILFFIPSPAAVSPPSRTHTHARAAGARRPQRPAVAGHRGHNGAVPGGAHLAGDVRA
jgi:hypothetical protein